ncbi:MULTISPECIES: hypothetical protein [Streptomycetaceae]|uniref:hypothetical protein n=1 Tax=Streptomycetaceae TaxID=2062 RepID=UPI000CDC5EDD|nr:MULTISPECIES: hypothetical protein [Streptomycetaceae]AUY51549.1 hypothetical protein C2142_24360 [Streptomyces sp. CB01881]MBP0454315.1 hypothetical protein [Kitasatospora sp. RG8]TYC74940.1 hypothetical protein EH183_24350 [Streptomyces sp. CB01881]
MTCDHLVCANCNGRVSDGRCPVCRANRARLQEQQGPFGVLSPAMLLALLAGLLAVALIARQALA